MRWRPCSFAHRPFPSMMMAMWAGILRAGTAVFIKYSAAQNRHVSVFADRNHRHFDLKVAFEEIQIDFRGLGQVLVLPHLRKVFLPALEALVNGLALRKDV